MPSELSVSRTVCRLAIVCLAWLVPAEAQQAVAFAAQSTGAMLRGLVVDSTDAVLADVVIRIRNVSTQVERSVTTDAEGRFTAAALEPGRYVIVAILSGFQEATLSDVSLEVGDQQLVTIQMAVAEMNERVHVDADYRMLSTSAAVSTVVDRRFVEGLPLSGRSFQSLLELTPGVTLVPATNSAQGGGQFSIGGQRSSANYFMVDGVSANTGIAAARSIGQSAAGALPTTTALGSTHSMVSVDALQEFRVQTSTYAPEFGRTPGGQISMLTRSGTNSLRVSASEYFRDDSMDANDWFANRLGLAKPRQRQNDFGFTIGGPIIRSRSFAFVSYEGLRLHVPRVVGGTGVPTVDVRQQAPEVMRPILEAFPIPNLEGSANGIGRFAASYSDPSRLDASAVRLDHHIGSGVSVFGRFNHTPSSSYTRGLALNSITMSQGKTDSVTAGMTWILSEGVVNDVRGNWTITSNTSRFDMDTFGGATAPPEAELLSPLDRDSSYATVQLSGTNGFNIGLFGENAQRQINLVDTLTYVRKRHTVKVGVDYRRLMPRLNRRGGNFTSYNFGAISNALGQRLSSLQKARISGENVVLFTNVSAYAQDHWEATQALSVTYGVRWESNPAPSSLNSRSPAVIADVAAPEPLSLAPSGTRLWKSTFNNLAPRLGLTYRVSRSPGRELALRGGGGRFYDTGSGISATAFGALYPYFATNFSTNVSYPAAGIAEPMPGSNAPGGLWAVDPNLELPYTWQWNLGIEQAIGEKQTLNVTYVGAAGHRQLLASIYNLQVSEFGATRIPVQISTNDARSSYRALQVQLLRRLSGGFQATVNYTLAKSSDTSSADFVNVPLQRGSAGDIAAEYGPADFDVRHVFSAGATYEIPWRSASRASVLWAGWQLSGMMRIRSAFPLSPTALVLFEGTTQSVRVNAVPGVPMVLVGSEYPGGKALNSGAFAIPQSNSIGNVPRNSLRGFPAQQVDVSLRRRVGLPKGAYVQLSFDLFNALNHPNFSTPNLTLNGSQFGVSTQMLNRGLGGLNSLYQLGGPRSGQIGVKIAF